MAYLFGTHQNLHTLHGSGPLCVLCQRCSRRSLIEETKIKPHGTRADMTPIDTVAKRLKCTSCNLKNSYAFVPPSREFAERWADGEIVETPGLE